MTTLHSTEPCLVLTVDQVNLWSCPKCKHGGDREHSRIPGKCKLAPKKDKVESKIKMPEQQHKAHPKPPSDAQTPLSGVKEEVPLDQMPDPAPLQEDGKDQNILENQKKALAAAK